MLQRIGGLFRKILKTEKAKPEPRKKQPAAGKRRKPSRKPAWNPAQFKVAPAEGKTRFHDLGLPQRVMHAIADLDFKYCTPIQAEILGSTLEGRDATGRAQTGTGKTAAFLITIFSRLLTQPPPSKEHAGRKHGMPRSLVIAPTRELVLQIAKDAQGLGKYTGLRIATAFGGMDYNRQKKQFQSNPVDVVVATPGRLLDFMGQRVIDLRQIEILVIDEADRMLDMGFIPDVRRIVRATPRREDRQTLLFSATLTDDVRRLAASWTVEPAIVEIEPDQVAVDTVEQLVYIVTTDDKISLVYNLVNSRNLERVMIFANRRDEARHLKTMLQALDFNCELISGDVPQRKRIRVLERFREGEIRILVATDVAGRGIHIEGISHVINYTLPQDPEDYVHRIGRTGRAGATGTSISFACENDSHHIPDIEQLLGHELVCEYPDEKLLAELPPIDPKKLRESRERRHNGPQRGGRNRRPRRR